MKFIHAADLHIDSPLRGLNRYEGAPADRLRSASRQALTALVDLALRERVALVLLAGDIYDGDWMDFHTGLFFRDQMVRLARAGIRVFIARGNHDAQSQITRQLPEVEGVHVFSADAGQTVRLPELGIAVHGRSFAQRAQVEDFVPDYPPPAPGLFNIGVLHTSLNGREGHDTYAPTSIAALCGKGYDYFALGHAHVREVVREAAPRIVFSGNLQGRHARETGAKGCELVTLRDGAIERCEPISLEVVRWHQLRLDARGLDSLDALAGRFADAVRAQTADAADRLHAVRLAIHGESPLHRIEAEQPGSIAAAAQAATQDLADLDIWVEQVSCAELRSPLDRAAAAARADAIGEVVQLVDALMQDEDALAELFSRALSGLKSGGLLAEFAPAKMGAAQLRARLQDAEATVLAQLSLEAQPGRGDEA